MLLYLDYEPGITVVGITDRLVGLIPLMEALQPDVLLLEWEQSCQSIEKLLTNVHTLEHPPKVILISGNPDEQEKMLAAGADYIIVKNAPPDQLLPIINHIRRTRDPVNPDHLTNQPLIN